MAAGVGEVGGGRAARGAHETHCNLLATFEDDVSFSNNGSVMLIFCPKALYPLTGLPSAYLDRTWLPVRAGRGVGEPGRCSGGGGRVRTSWEELWRQEAF